MRRCFLALLAVAVMSLCAATAFAQSGLPQLVGTWRGPCEVVLEKSGFTTQDVEFVILKQQGHLFTGVKKYIKEPKRIKTEEKFTGVVLDDGKSIYFSDSDAGYNFATLTAPDKLQIVYIHDGLGNKQAPMASYITLTKQK